ncbi:MAG: hypothetical protein CM15mV4_1990 [Caudoviricetes sp.]|nr:MAG: hypothetical protein CM15mV4_1990 [Caudoviricetes sp.]
MEFELLQNAVRFKTCFTVASNSLDIEPDQSRMKSKPWFLPSGRIVTF